MSQRRDQASGRRIVKRLVIFFASAVASALIGVYVAGLFQKEMRIEILAEQRHSVEYKSDEGLVFTVHKKDHYGRFLYTQVISVINRGDFPLKNFRVKANPGDWYTIWPELGTPLWMESGECVVYENETYYAEWECKLLNPGEEVHLGFIDSAGRMKCLRVTLRAEGLTQYKELEFKKEE